MTNKPLTCADCGETTTHRYEFFSRMLCGNCKYNALTIDIDDEKLDDPRRGQSADINAENRR